MNRLRRKLLAWLAIGAGSLYLAPRQAMSQQPDKVDLALLKSLLGDLHSAAAIAARLPANADLLREARLLYGELANCAARNSRVDCLAWYQARREDDFASGRTLLADGWVLARCEAALCLLAVCDD